MSMATAMKWKAVGVDLTQGFIQAELPKDGKAIYISPPPGHVEEPDVVYQVLKPLYGMPHSGRCLYVTWSKWLEGQGLMVILLLFLQKQNLAFAVYLLGSVLSLPD